jgi:hypothetical protein
MRVVTKDVKINTFGLKHNLFIYLFICCWLLCLYQCYLISDLTSIQGTLLFEPSNQGSIPPSLDCDMGTTCGRIQWECNGLVWCSGQH